MNTIIEKNKLNKWLQHFIKESINIINITFNSFPFIAHVLSLLNPKTSFKVQIHKNLFTIKELTSFCAPYFSSKKYYHSFSHSFILFHVQKHKTTKNMIFFVEKYLKCFYKRHCQVDNMNCVKRKEINRKSESSLNKQFFCVCCMGTDVMGILF